MFGELPKLFDRNFAIGFFLPVMIFIILSGIILGQQGIVQTAVTFIATDLLIGTTVLGAFAWVGGIFLLAINRDLYRLLEGYGKYNPIKLFLWFERNRFNKVLKELDKLNEEYLQSIEEKKEFPAKKRINRNKAMRKLADEFPDKEEHLLPTPFGNVVRSFENYPRVMYGLEATDGWGRLLAILPKDYIELVDTSKTQVDFWVNLGLVFFLLQLECLGYIYIVGNRYSWWGVIILMGLELISLIKATSAAKEWGDFVKSTFDMFVPTMREALGFELPKNRDEEKKQWTNFSQAIIYRLPERLPEFKKQESRKVVNSDSKKSRVVNKK